MEPLGSSQTSLATTMLAAYMDPVRCDVKENKQETNHPNPIALDRNKLIKAIWDDPPQMSESSVCESCLNHLMTLPP